jgi:hypothetical protein
MKQYTKVFVVVAVAAISLMTSSLVSAGDLGFGGCKEYDGGVYNSSYNGTSCGGTPCAVEQCKNPLGYTMDCSGFVNCPGGGG